MKTASPSPSVRNYFVDEAGDGHLFNRQGRVIVGTKGCFVVAVQPGARCGRHTPGAIRGLLRKEKAADISGYQRPAGDIGSLDRNRKITRRGAEFRPLAMVI